MSAQVRWRNDRGAWYLVVYDAGTRRVKRLGPTQADKRRGERRAQEWNEKRLRGSIGLEKPKPKPVAFDEFAKRWLRTKVFLPIERGLDNHLSSSTARLRERIVRLHLAPFLGDKDIRGLEISDVDGLMEHFLETGSPPSRRSMEIALGTLRLILADAMGKGLVVANVVDQWKANQPRGRGSSRLRPIEEGRVLDSDEREEFLETAERQAPHYFPFILFFAETGCRYSEAVNLRWSDVDLDGGIARLYRQKTGGKPDDVELSKRLSGVLRRIKPDIHPPEALAFTTEGGHRIRHENFRRRIWNPIVSERFGSDRRVTPHSLRHTWATLHLARGTPIEWVREMGGWTSAKMLLDVYGHYLPREMRGFSDSLAPADRTRPHQGHAGA